MQCRHTSANVNTHIQLVYRDISRSLRHETCCRDPAIEENRSRSRNYDELPPHFEFELCVEATREARDHSGATALGSECYVLFYVFQSAYRPAHSCETALVRTQDDMLQSLESRKSTTLVLLDLRAAFDTVHHQILLDRLHVFGMRGNAHKWMQSYLSQRSQVVNIRDTRSRRVQLPCGVPQGSVLGRLLFSIYCIELISYHTTYTLMTHNCMSNFLVINQPKL